ncbi:MAG: alpha/beta fold hydrolase [Hyphomonadaceae bacterium]|nr:alpha/beta fold hydrolase [Hyphomonadaceae bacterium]
MQKNASKLAPANGIELCYDTFGNRAEPALLLIMGLAAQMIAWEEEFCERLAARGYFVIRFDNRDIGLSTRFPQYNTPDLMALLGQALAGKPVAAPYALRDMAADAIGLLDALGIERAHVVGASMGGAIGQEMAIHRGARLLSLTSIMSSTGDPRLPQATPEAMAVLLAPPPTDRESYFESYKRTWAVLRGPGFPLDEAKDLERAARAWDRGLNPPGVARQLAAILASGDRTTALGGVRVPTLVIHGDADPLVRHAGGIATAKAIPGARLLTIKGMGHALPISMWPQLIDAIAAHAR